MSKLTDLAENLLADMVRGQGLTLPADFEVGLLSAASDSAYTEVSWTGYARQAVTRALANWAGTQGAGTTAASSGTSHATSNNNAIDFGLVGAGGSASISHIGIFSGATDLFCYATIDPVLEVTEDDPVVFQPGSIVWTLGLTGGVSDYLSNKLIDLIFRAQAYSWPSSAYTRLFTAAPNNAGGGTEVSGGGYARVAIASTLAAWSGTQGAGTTVASTGTDGRISNNAAITFANPSANWGTVSHMALNDAASSGNLLLWRALAIAKTVNSGGPAPRFNADALGITFS